MLKMSNAFYEFIEGQFIETHRRLLTYCDMERVTEQIKLNEDFFKENDCEIRSTENSFSGHRDGMKISLEWEEVEILPELYNVVSIYSIMKNGEFVETDRGSSILPIEEIIERIESYSSHDLFKENVNTISFIDFDEEEGDMRIVMTWELANISE